MGNIRREKEIELVRYTSQIELVKLINYGVQTNASLNAFAGTNTSSQKLKTSVERENTGIVREQSSIFGGSRTYFYRMKNQELDFLEALVNNAIGHAVSVLRKSNVFLDVVRTYSDSVHEVKYRSEGFVRGEESKLAEFVFSYFNSEKRNKAYHEKFYNYDEEYIRVIVFDDRKGYNMFLEEVKRQGKIKKIMNQFHVVLENEQDAIRSANIEMSVYMLEEDAGHQLLSEVDVELKVGMLSTRTSTKINETIKNAYVKAKNNADRFSSAINKENE